MAGNGHTSRVGKEMEQAKADISDTGIGYFFLTRDE
jgi:hypothetical protein